MRNLATESSTGSVVPTVTVDSTAPWATFRPTLKILASGEKSGKEQAVFPALLKPRIATGSRSGFTLIEILVAVVIMSVGFMGVTALSSISLNSSVQTRAIDNCYNLAFDLFDRMHSNQQDINSLGSSFTINPASCGATASDIDQVCNTMQTIGFDDGLLRVDISNDDPIPGLVTATITVEYSSRGGKKECQVVDIIPHS